jgi:hypothetical protein
MQNEYLCLIVYFRDLFYKYMKWNKKKQKQQHKQQKQQPTTTTQLKLLSLKDRIIIYPILWNFVVVVEKIQLINLPISFKKTI